jgi:hypothetical protein
MKRLPFHLPSSFLILIFAFCLLPSAFTQTLPLVIDVDKALRTAGTIKLSQLVDWVELVELEGKKGAFLRSVYWAHVDERHVVVGGKQPNLMLVFSREGKFLRQIGATGKGPGEYEVLEAAAISPDGQVIILGDPFSKKLIAYSVEGKILKEITLPQGSPSRWVTQIAFIDNETFAVLYRRPRTVVEGYHRVQFFNTRLEPVESVLPVTDPVMMTLKGRYQDELITNPDGLSYHEQIGGTVYQIGPNRVASPVFELKIKNNPLTAELFSNDDYVAQRDEMKRRTYIWSTCNLPDYLIANGYSFARKPFLLVHDKRAGKSFSIPVANPCYRSESKRPSIENDIFGIEPVYFGEYQTGSDFWILNVSVEEAQMSRDLDCLKKLKVTQPEVRDRIVQIARNSTGEEGPVLVLMHRKK